MNEYFSFDYEANDIVEENRGSKTDERKTVTINVSNDNASVSLLRVVNRFQEFMIKTGKSPEFFDFGTQTLFEIIAEWHAKHNDEVQSVESSDDTDKEKVHDIFSAMGIDGVKHEDLENAFDKMCEAFQQIMENKKS